jgi:trehalose-phosphatase
MKNFDQNKSPIKVLIRNSGGIILMLDFDGTLSPIAPTPNSAYLPKTTKEYLKKCSERFPVVIISGRSLADIRKKVGINGLVYAGSHGLEWLVDQRQGRFKVPEENILALKMVKKRFGDLQHEFPGILFEEKGVALAIHYRKIGLAHEKSFKAQALAILQSFLSAGFELIKGKKVFELRPAIDWTKGHFAEFIVRHLQHDTQKQLLPIYIGDDTTDEDVFGRLPYAVTIRVGKKAGSAAQYYLKNQKQVDRFLEWVLEETET